MPHEIAIGLGPELVDRLFPFLLAIDERLRVLRLGRGMQKICAGAEPGMPLLDLLTIYRPQITPSFAALRDNTRSTFMLDSKSTGIRLRGEDFLLRRERVFRRVDQTEFHRAIPQRRIIQQYAVFADRFGFTA